MAQATTVSDSTTTRYFCHQCDVEVAPLPDFVCPQCHSGFIEELTSETNPEWFERGSEYEPAQRPLLHDILESIYGQFAQPADSAGGGTSNAGGTAASGGRPPDTAPTGGPATRPTQPRPQPNQQPDVSAMALEGIFQQILSSVAGTAAGIPLSQSFGRPYAPRGATIHGQVNFDFPLFHMVNLHGNPGDYAWGQGGLDAVITQLLNQFDSSGPAPMAKDDIDRIPFTQITKEDVDRNMQCSVCMDDYKLGEDVRKLECSHVFHTDCIIPWLQMHATCPICRTNLSKSQTGPTDRSRPAGNGGPSSASGNSTGSTGHSYDELLDYD